MEQLPARCRQVFTLRKVYGLSQKEIAAELKISENTVESHLRSIYAKLEVPSRAAAARIGFPVAMKPLFVSKANTVAQIVLAGTVLLTLQVE